MKKICPERFATPINKQTCALPRVCKIGKSQGKYSSILKSVCINFYNLITYRKNDVIFLRILFCTLLTFFFYDLSFAMKRRLLSFRGVTAF